MTVVIMFTRMIDMIKTINKEIKRNKDVSGDIDNDNLNNDDEDNNINKIYQR